jgi:tRNA(fMet)-specific endonuclease VapC
VKYLLDTNVVIGLSKGISRLEERVHQQDPADVGLSVIVLHGLYFGAYKGQRVAANLEAIADLKFDVVNFDKEDARHAGQIRAELTARGRPIGPYDILLAGQAISKNLTLITHNTREFSRVHGLHIEDWEA